MFDGEYIYMILSNTLPIIIQNKQNQILQMQYLKNQKNRINLMMENNMYNKFYNQEEIPVQMPMQFNNIFNNSPMYYNVNGPKEINIINNNNHLHNVNNINYNIGNQINNFSQQNYLNENIKKKNNNKNNFNINNVL